MRPDFDLSNLTHKYSLKSLSTVCTFYCPVFTSCTSSNRFLSRIAMHLASYIFPSTLNSTPASAVSPQYDSHHHILGELCPGGDVQLVFCHTYVFFVYPIWQKGLLTKQNSTIFCFLATFV